MRLDGTVVIVTGSTRGLGRAFAEALAHAGARVVVNGTNAALVEEVVAGIGQDAAVGVAGSVAEWDVAERLTQTALDRFGRLDGLVNNAGIVRDRTLLKMTEDEFDAVIDVNLKGVFACTRFAAQAMRDGDGGAVVSVVSNTGLRGGFGQTNYAASKAGVAGMIRTWALELERYQIRVNGLWPVALTDMTGVIVEREQRAAEEEGRTPLTPRQLGFGETQEVAPIVVYLLSDACALNGQILTSNGTKVALWSHPVEIVNTYQEAWSADELAAVIPAQFGPFLQSVGGQLA